MQARLPAHTRDGDDEAGSWAKSGAHGSLRRAGERQEMNAFITSISV